MSKRTGQRVTAEAVEAFLNAEANSRKMDAFASMTDQFRHLDRKAATLAAAKEFEPRWAQAPLAVIGGKDLLTAAFSWAQKKFSVSLSIHALVQEFRADEVPIEVKNAIRAICA